MRDGRPPAGDSPEALLARYRGGRDPEALGLLFDATAPGLFRIALSLAPDAATAEEAVQETFLAVIHAAERCDPSRPVVPWLVSILRHKVLDARRRERRVPDPLRLEPRLLPEDPPAGAARREEIARVRAAMEGLAEPYRTVALLRWEYGLEPGEIAHLRGEPPGTVRSTLSRALEKLRRALGTGAALAVVLGAAAPAGLASIRAAVMEEAAVAAPAAAGIALGGTLVTHATFALLLAGTFAAGALAGWGGTRPAAPPGGDSAPRAPAAGPATARLPDSPPPASPGAGAEAAPGGDGGSAPARGTADPAAAAAAVIPDAEARIPLLLDSLRGEWQYAFSAGTLLSQLPPGPAVDALRGRWGSIPDPDDRRQILKAFAFSRNPRLLEVLDLGFRDPHAGVRAWAADFLEWYAGRDFREDPAAYADWKRRGAGRSLGEVLRASKRDLAARLREAEGVGMDTLARTLQRHSWLQRDLDVPDEGMIAALEAALPRAEGEGLAALLGALCELDPPEAVRRRAVLPLLDRDESAARTVLGVLGEYRQGWAGPEFVARLSDPRPSVPAAAAGALEDLGDVRFVPDLVAALEQGPPPETAAALEGALYELTGAPPGGERGAAGWNDWWARNRSRLTAGAGGEE